jgi:hypothetical protein
MAYFKSKRLPTEKLIQRLPPKLIGPLVEIVSIDSVRPGPMKPIVVAERPSDGIDEIYAARLNESRVHGPLRRRLRKATDLKRSPGKMRKNREFLNSRIAELVGSITAHELR